MIYEDGYSIKRKKLLQALDRGEKPKIIDLGMYDLTQYFNEGDNQEISITEMIMSNKNLERKINHVKEEIYFSPAQKKALDILQKEDRVIFSAPTSFGKTLLVKEYIYNNKPKNIVFIVPTNALAYELEKSFKNNQNFKEYTIYNKNLINLKEGNRLDSVEKLLFIGTQEKFLELEANSIDLVDLFIIDEAYKLEESTKEQRAYKLSETFLKAFVLKSKKIFLLSPNAIFEGFDRYNFYIYKTNFNAVDKNFIVLNKNDFFDTLFKKGKNDKSILFCKTPKAISTFVTKFENELEIENSYEEFIHSLELDIHPDWDVIKLLRKGILTHHGQMPKYIQNKMINIFNNGSINILIGTNSISEGINTKTKNLFIDPEYGNLDNKLLIKNTIGRAGRLGEYPIGYVYSTKKIESEISEDIIIKLAISKEEELEEIENTKSKEKINEIGKKQNLESEDIEDLLNKYKISLDKLDKIINYLKKDINYPNLDNLPFMAKSIMKREYMADPYEEGILIRGVLQSKFKNREGKDQYINNFSDRIEFYNIQNEKKKKNKKKNSDIINSYMKFIYVNLEYYIMPIVDIGMDIYEKNPKWEFGNNVLKVITDCKKKYNKRMFSLNIDDLSEKEKSILNSLKDYGIMNELKNIDHKILAEIESRLKIRYSTIDVLNAIKYLSKNSDYNKDLYKIICDKYIDM